jgi:hypothetical protein
MKAGVDYYAATLSFAQETVPAFTVRIRFLHGAPSWVRAYECFPGGTVNLLHDLRPTNRTKGEHEYVDSAEDVPGTSARVYLFERRILESRTEEAEPSESAVARR